MTHHSRINELDCRLNWYHNHTIYIQPNGVAKLITSINTWPTGINMYTSKNSSRLDVDVSVLKYIMSINKYKLITILSYFNIVGDVNHEIKYKHIQFDFFLKMFDHCNYHKFSIPVTKVPDTTEIYTGNTSILVRTLLPTSSLEVFFSFYSWNTLYIVRISREQKCVGSVCYWSGDRYTLVKSAAVVHRGAHI